jgi:hypothetical protein
MLGQLLGDKGWKVDVPAAMSLGLTEDQATRHLGGGFDD